MSELILSIILSFLLVFLYLYHGYTHGGVRSMPLLFFGVNCILYVPILAVFSDHGSVLLIYFLIAHIFLLFFFIQFQKNHILPQKISSHARTQLLETHQTDIGDFYEKSGNKAVVFMRLYNEEQEVEKCILDLLKHGYSNILILNDGSTDDGINVIQNIKKKKANICIIHHTTRAGGGAANKTLFALAQMYDPIITERWYVTFDADGQMRAQDLEAFCMYQRKNPKIDIFIGSRFIFEGSAKNISLIRKIILIGSRFVTLVFSRIWLTDPHNGFRMMRGKILPRIQIQADDMYYASELVHSIQTENIPYMEVPVQINYSSYSYQKGQRNRNAIKIFLHLVYEHLFSK